MNIFFAGATGVIGRQLLPRLIEAGHTVTAITRSPDRVAKLRAAGALPAIIGRLAAGRWGYYFMTEQRGASNARAKQQFDWRPQYASWRDGFRAELTAQV